MYSNNSNLKGFQNIENQSEFTNRPVGGNGNTGQPPAPGTSLSGIINQ